MKLLSAAIARDDTPGRHAGDTPYVRLRVHTNSAQLPFGGRFDPRPLVCQHQGAGVARHEGGHNLPDRCLTPRKAGSILSWPCVPPAYPEAETSSAAGTSLPAHIGRIVESAPPLSAEDAALLRALLPPVPAPAAEAAA